MDAVDARVLACKREVKPARRFVCATYISQELRDLRRRPLVVEEPVLLQVCNPRLWLLVKPKLCTFGCDGVSRRAHVSRYSDQQATTPERSLYQVGGEGGAMHPSGPSSRFSPSITICLSFTGCYVESVRGAAGCVSWVGSNRRPYAVNDT